MCVGPAGNQCFFNSLLQIFYHTTKLHAILYRGYPNVEDLPAWLNEEELMNYEPVIAEKLPDISNAPKTPERKVSSPQTQGQQQSSPSSECSVARYLNAVPQTTTVAQIIACQAAPLVFCTDPWP